jgi:hypothetical protein
LVPAVRPVRALDTVVTPATVAEEAKSAVVEYVIVYDVIVAAVVPFVVPLDPAGIAVHVNVKPVVDQADAISPVGAVGAVAIF